MLDHEIVGDCANEGPDVWHDRWDPEKVVKIFVESLIAKSSDESKKPPMEFEWRIGNEKIFDDTVFILLTGKSLWPD